jgi:LytS/YehU family sensor histidine kinase
LYESSAATVPLEKEIANLQNYMALEKLRFGQRLTLCFDIKGNTSLVRIPPLVLLAFVENGFKHGLKGQMGPVRIDLYLEVQTAWLLFRVCNPAGESEEKRQEGDKSEDREPGGIGLKNVRRRLDILYGSQYELRLERTATLFSVHLKIPLS